MKKALVYSTPDQLTEGAFGQALTWVLEILPFLEREGYRPEDVFWDIKTRGYGTLIPGMFLPRSVGRVDSSCASFNLTQMKIAHAYHYGFTSESFIAANAILNRWFIIPEIVRAKVPEFPQTGGTLGIHYRGTDKNKDTLQTNPLTIDECIILAKDFMATEKFSTLFVCSDEVHFTQRIRTFFPNTELLVLEQLRSNDMLPLHLKGAQSTDDVRRELMLNALRDVIALSKCSVVLKCSSALSAWAKIINPACRVLQVSAMKQPWFPSGAIPPYTPRTHLAKSIMNRSMRHDHMTIRLQERTGPPL